MILPIWIFLMNFRDRGFSDCSDQYEEIIDAPRRMAAEERTRTELVPREAHRASISFAWPT